VSIHLNVRETAPESVAPGVQRRSLLSDRTVPGIRFGLDCLALDARSELPLAVGSADLAWFQVLEGELVLARAGGEQQLSDAHVVFLPPGFSGTVRSTSGASLLLAVVPEASRLDPDFASHPPGFRVVDWRNEPLLESKHDAFTSPRQRSSERRRSRAR
jgi:hypothetical protein